MSASKAQKAGLPKGFGPLIALLAEVAAAKVPPIPFRSVQPTDEVVGNISAEALQVLAYARWLEQEKKVVELRLTMETDASARAVLLAQVHTFDTKQQLLRAAGYLLLNEKASTWGQAAVTIRHGGVVVISEQSRAQFALAVDSRANTAHREAATASFGASPEDRTPGLGHLLALLNGAHEDEDDALVGHVLDLLAGANLRVSHVLEEMAGSKPNGHDHGEQPGAGH